MGEKRRVLLKLSGEAFGGGSLGVNPDVVSEIAKDIAKQFGVGAAVCENIIGAFFERARTHVLAGERVRITGFGTFRPRLRKAGERYNPKSGERFQVEEAIKIAMELRPDVIVMDIRMPGMDGLEVCRKVKADAALGDVLAVTVKDENDKKDRALWGLFSRLVANLVTGVTKGYEKSLEFVGVGYKIAMNGKTVKMDVGFSHEVDFPLPAGIEGKVEKNTLTLSGIDKQLVGEVAARIRRIRKPEPYKGKGIKYVDEVIRRKAGKAAKATGAK